MGPNQVHAPDRWSFFAMASFPTSGRDFYFEIEENPTSVLNFQANSQVSDGTTIMFTDLVPTETMKYGGFRISSEEKFSNIDKIFSTSKFDLNFKISNFSELF